MKNIQRFFDLTEINPKLSLLHERFEIIHQEFLQNKDKLILINFGGEAGYYMRENIAYKGWKVAPIYANHEDFSQINGAGSGSLGPFEQFKEIDGEIVKFKLNTVLLPTLTQTLIEAGINKRVGISVVYPGNEIAWHIDADPEKQGLAIIRGLYGLDVVEEEGKESFIYLVNDKAETEKVVFKNNEFVFFWGRSRHKVENNLSQPRYMICFDTEIPYDQLNS